MLQVLSNLININMTGRGHGAVESGKRLGIANKAVNRCPIIFTCQHVNRENRV